MSAHYPAHPDAALDFPAVTLDSDSVRIGDAILSGHCVEHGVTITPSDDGTCNAVTLTIYASTIDVTDSALPHVNVNVGATR